MLGKGMVSLSHFHITCPDKHELARWYQKKLGFEVLYDLEAKGEKGGPLFISADNGRTGIAVFSRKETRASVLVIPAFEVAPDYFVEFYQREKRENSDLKIYDHHISYSIYILDPTGTKIEIVSHQYEKTGEFLKKAGISFLTMNPSDDPDYNKSQK